MLPNETLAQTSTGKGAILLFNLHVFWTVEETIVSREKPKYTQGEIANSTLKD